jgi:hypothetical protein
MRNSSLSRYLVTAKGSFRRYLKLLLTQTAETNPTKAASISHGITRRISQELVRCSCPFFISKRMTSAAGGSPRSPVSFFAGF